MGGVNAEGGFYRKKQWYVNAVSIIPAKGEVVDCMGPWLWSSIAHWNSEVKGIAI
jgi:hypothetical protein